MKTKVLNFIQECEAQLGIQIRINIGYQSDNNLYGSVTVGHFGFMLYETWQPQSDTTFQFKLDGESGNVFDYETIFGNMKPANKLIIYGHFKPVFLNKIIDAIKACKSWSVMDKDVKTYSVALKKAKNYYADLIR